MLPLLRLPHIPGRFDTPPVIEWWRSHRIEMAAALSNRGQCSPIAASPVASIRSPGCRVRAKLSYRGSDHSATGAYLLSRYFIPQPRPRLPSVSRSETYRGARGWQGFNLCHISFGCRVTAKPSYRGTPPAGARRPQKLRQTSSAYSCWS